MGALSLLAELTDLAAMTSDSVTLEVGESFSYTRYYAVGRDIAGITDAIAALDGTEMRDYETTIGHLSVYYDAGGLFDFEVNAGRYLAGDWGATTTISRKFGSGWEVGGYATLTDVPFATFGEGSFDKAIYVSVPIDWIISSPNRTKRRLFLRPITRDGGAQLSNARRLYREIENFQNASFKREIGRVWK